MGVSSYNIFSWNVGTDRDFAVMDSHQHICPKKMGFHTITMENGIQTGEKIDWDGIKAHRDSKIKAIFSEHPSDIYFLQEAGGEELERLKSWYEGETIEIVQDNDPVIGYNKDRFEVINSIKGGNLNYLIVDLWDKTNNKCIRAVSVHLTSAGNPLNPDPREAQQGDEDLQMILGQLAEREMQHPADAVIIGLDANAPKEYTGRIGALIEKGFVSDPSSRDTGALIKGYVEQYVDKVIDGEIKRERQNLYGAQAKIDHICAKEMKSRVEILRSDRENTVPLLDLRENPSDHRPVLATVNLIEKTWKDTWNSLLRPLNLFSSKP